MLYVLLLIPFLLPIGVETQPHFSLRAPLDPQDLESIDPTYYRSLNQLLMGDLDEMGLDLTFSVQSSRCIRVLCVCVCCVCSQGLSGE